ncbi:MAG: gamma-glutamylcyclotransferase [Candidatus Sumerlaeia bacterium]|nr:gamma-glutamylcyclotransferase [Candidatus Sumerlaeia bacterium]
MPYASLVPVFVYGTLKRGYWNHDPYLGRAVSCQPATVRGRLHVRHTGTPFLELPPSAILARGTADFRHDQTTQKLLAEGVEASLPDDDDDWLVVRGELALLPPEPDLLRQLDDLEGFDPDMPDDSLYHRVLAPIRAPELLAAWVYVVPPDTPPEDLTPAVDPTFWDANVEIEALRRRRDTEPDA